MLLLGTNPRPLLRTAIWELVSILSDRLITLLVDLFDLERLNL